MMHHRVFVYGTLKRTQSNHGLLEREKFIGEAHTSFDYTMGHAGFPVVFNRVYGQPCGRIRGEIFLVRRDCLAELDRLENEGEMYHRKLTPVHLDGSDKVWNAMMYVGDDVYWRKHHLPFVRPHHDGSITWLP